MKRILSLLSLLLCGALLLCLSGCGGKANQEFAAALPGNVYTLDPQAASRLSERIVIGSIFEGLCRIDEEGNTVPGAADRWEQNDTATRFTFRLRSGIRWSDDEPVTADDFVYGVLRGLRVETGGVAIEDLFVLKNARAIYEGEAEESSLGLYAENDRTLVAELETGCPDFPTLTAGIHYMPCRQDYFEESAGQYGLTAGCLLTNGPFTFPHGYAWNTDYNEEKISLVRSESYKGSRKTVPKRLVYLIDYDNIVNTDPLQALSNGVTDILQVTEADSRKAKELGMETVSLNDGVTGLLLNPECNALSYLGTRELFTRTIDRRETLSMRRDRMEARGIMAECVRWNNEAYYGPDGWTYALQDDTVTEGIPSLLEMLDVSSVPCITVLCPDDESSIAVANSFLGAWNKKLHNAFNIHPMPEAELRSRVAWGDYEAALYTLRAGGTTPFYTLAAFSGSASPTLMMRSGYDEALWEASYDLTHCRELEGLIRDAHVFYPLYQERSYYALAPGVTHVTVGPDQRIDFSQARKD